MTENKQEDSLTTSEMPNSQQKNGMKPATPSTRSNQLLRQARRTRTWSQGDLAERIGVAKETISRWENGVSRPQPQQLSRLCETFQMTPDKLGYALDQVEENASPTEEASHPLPAAIAEDTTRQPEVATGERRTLPSRRVLVIGGIALGALALTGGTLAWFTQSNQLATSPRHTQGNQSAPSPRHWPTAKYDLHHRSQLVRVAQYMLQARQYDLGPAGVDGAFGPVTQFAVKAFQKDQHLPESGVVDGNTWDRLIIPADTTSRGSQVTALQECLQPLNLVPKKLSVDGDVGPQTIGAIRRFRQKQHLPMKDVADLNLWCLLVGGTISK
ncbi:peptidoglycan-binding protein [Dictyobacter formicarum]|uniref:HTH cro/C1-type domain-containing protein n=1 Tax=Dictyobacter formicarum TaxID=2778368 RepID=A0ABQ3VH08_9CHLR|nr:peptidoglycan-binding protein [Dictyobacter formicarum]GHO84966.1 hypothetical protein KSZ_29720 [Dictyobacter formicarum]